MYLYFINHIIMKYLTYFFIKLYCFYICLVFVNSDEIING